MPPPHRTPLKRVSQGSLFALSRSGAFPDAPHGLGFIEPAMAEFVDEVEALQVNLEGMKNLSDSLATFNESFASLLYIMNMNALTTDWPQAPTETSYLLAKRRAEREAINAMEALKQKQAEALRIAEAQAAADRTAATEVTEGETTYATTSITVPSTSEHNAKQTMVSRRKVGKQKMTAKEKKERGLEVERIIQCLPLEFRGSDPGLRKSMEMVIEGLLDAPNKAVRLTDLIKPPDLVQARVNKCLIALVNRKVVRKDNSSGTVLYHWLGIP